MKKIILFLLPLVLSVACIKETLEPGLEVFGEYVMEDGTGWATQYIAFMDGKYSVYTSRTTGFTFMEKSIWDYSQGEFSVKQDWYSIRDGRLFVGNKDCGKISFADETLTLGGKKYTRVATFQAEPYSSIVLPEGVEKTTDYNAKSLSFPISVQRLIPSGSISLSNIPAWIENATLANGQFSFDIPDNNTRYARTATIRFSYPGAQTVTFTLTQQFSQASIELTPDSENCDYTGGAFSFDFSVNNPREGESVTAQSQKNWITDVVVSGNAVSYKVAENNTGSTRKGTIRLSYGSLATKDFAVTQSYTASSITLTPASQDCDYTGGSFSFDFAVNNPREGVTATAQSQNNWITDVTLEDNTISYKVAENNSGSARNGTIRLSYGTYATKDFAVSQSYTASSIILTPATQECDYTGGTFSFDFVVSNPREVGSVTAQSRSDWITDVSLDGNTISYKVAENNSGAARNGAIRLSYGNYAIKDFTVSQSYTASVITLTPASQECDYTGGSFSFNFTISNPRVGATVTAQSQNTWITDVSLEGNTVRYKTAENHSGLSRSGIIHLLYGNYAANDFVINQSGMPVQSLMLNKNSLAMLSGTSETLVVIVDPADAPLQWSSNDTSVATVDQTGCVSAVGNGNATITVSAKNGMSTSCILTVTKTVKDITLNKTSLTLAEGLQERLTATILPSDASDKSLTWSSDNTSAATVDQSGLVTAVSIGTATIMVVANDGSGKSASCSVTVVPIDLSANGSSNCYIVSSVGAYSFRTTKGNSSTSVGSVSGVAVLWESYGTTTTLSVGSIITSVSYSNNTIVFSTPSTLKNGNAVIAAMDASGTILWSWHIWVCSGYDPESSVQTYYSAAKMMDRNLGSITTTIGNIGALGLLYQWGRKDPFLPNDISSTILWPAAMTAQTDRKHSIAHPTTLYYSYSDSSGFSNYDWISPRINVSGWTDGTRWSNVKTIYDPCPNGWRVPSGGESGGWSQIIGTTGVISCYYDNTNKGVNCSGIFGADRIIWYPSSSSNEKWWTVTSQSAQGYISTYSGAENLYFYHNAKTCEGRIQVSGKASLGYVRCEKEE